MRKFVVDIETDDIKATKIWCIVAIDEDNNIKTFDPNNIEEGIKYLQQANTAALTEICCSKTSAECEFFC